MDNAQGPFHRSHTSTFVQLLSPAGTPLMRLVHLNTLTRMSLNKEHAVSAEEAVIIPIEVIQQPTHSW